MTSKEWLLRYRGINERINVLTMRKIALQTELTSGVTNYTPNENKHTKNPTNANENKLILYAELTSNIDNELTKALEIRLEIETAIEKIENNIYATLLRLKYIDGLTWEQVADVINYTENWTKVDLHNKALREINKFIK